MRPFEDSCPSQGDIEIDWGVWDTQPMMVVFTVVDWLTGSNNLQKHHVCKWYNKKVKKKVCGLYPNLIPMPHARLVRAPPFLHDRKYAPHIFMLWPVADLAPAVRGWRQRAFAAQETKQAERSPPVAHWSRTFLQPVWKTSLSQPHRCVKEVYHVIPPIYGNFSWKIWEDVEPVDEFTDTYGLFACNSLRKSKKHQRNPNRAISTCFQP